MALGSAMVDRARIIRRAPSPVKIEGRTQMTTVRGAWFRCRLNLRSDSQSQGPGDNPRTTRRPTLMLLPLDIEGRAVDLRHTDKVEVDSPELGLNLWEVDGEPEPLRKKRRVIGYEVPVKRVEQQESDHTMQTAGQTG